MKTNLYHDTRRTKKNPNLDAPIRISINHEGSSAYIDTGVSVRPNQWEKKSGRWEVVRHPLSVRYNMIIAERKLAVEKVLESLREAGELRGRSLAEIRKRVVDIINNEDGDAPLLFMEKFKVYISRKTNAMTRRNYENTMAKIYLFDAKADNLHFEDINRQWLSDFDLWMTRKHLSNNSRVFQFRNIRAVYNEWGDEINAPNPFKKFKVTMEQTRNRSLCADTLTALFSAECTKSQQKYLDYFKLVFLLAGLNIGDLAELKGLTNGRVEGLRHKTGQPFSLCVLPEAGEILNKYKGKTHLVNILDTYKSARYFARIMNRSIKRIGMKFNRKTNEWEGTPIAPDASVYWARVSWASIAAELDIPERTIGAALAHSTKTSVTEMYIRTDMRKKVDDAQKKVADYILNAKKSE